MAVHYLFGDPEGVADEAEALWRDAPEPRLRLDAHEAGRAEELLLGAGLFDQGRKAVLVRDLTKAKAAEAARWLRLAGRVPEGALLVLCAPGMSPRKHRWHAELLRAPGVERREVRPLVGPEFESWLDAEAARAGVALAPEARALAAEQLAGMRQAARAFLARAADYLDAGETLDAQTAAALLGEHAPAALEDWLRAMLARAPGAGPLALRLLAEGTPAPWMLAALGERLVQLLLLAWHRARRAPDAHAKARIFPFARAAAEAALRHWTPQELVAAVQQVAEAERRLKSGAVGEADAFLELAAAFAPPAGGRSRP